MCTSFVVHSDTTLIGMNFDISTRPIKFVLKDDDQLLILQKDNGQFLPAFGMNSSGTFMNLIMVNPTEEGKYRRGKNCVHIMKLLDVVLSNRVELSQLKDFLEDNTIVNVPNYSVHSMISGRDRKTFVVEPGRENIDMDSIDRDFVVLTNFSLKDKMVQADTHVSGDGHDRYRKAYDTLIRNTESFDVETGFALLQETVQHHGDYPTQLSVMFIPDEHKVYFTLNGEFEKVFAFSFANKQISTSKGFANDSSSVLSKKGILLSELETW